MTRWIKIKIYGNRGKEINKGGRLDYPDGLLPLDNSRVGRIIASDWGET